MKTNLLVLLSALMLSGCSLPPLDAHVPKDVAAVKGKIVFRSNGRTPSDGFFLVQGKLVDNTGGKRVFFSDSTRTLAISGDDFLIVDGAENIIQTIDVEPVGPSHDFDISPNGKTIVFVGEENSVNNMYTVSVEGNDLKKLTEYDYDYWYFGGPKYSSDGKKILFNRARQEKQAATLFVRDLATGQTVDILDGIFKNGAEADWSPDGGSIAFVHIDEAGFRNLYRYDVATKKTVALTHFTKDYWGQVYNPSYSPWGDQICFALEARDKNAGAEIFAIDVDGNNLIRLSAAQKTDRYPGWAKDSYPDWGK
jgi:Tol biopolymer transport system component